MKKRHRVGSGKKTRLDLILDTVKPREREVVIDTEELTEEQRERVLATARGRGLHAARAALPLRPASGGSVAGPRKRRRRRSHRQTRGPPRGP